MTATVDPASELALLVEVVERGSFSAAARYLGLPKSSVSRKVAALETKLGVRLLHRSTRSLRLTQAGELFYAEAKLILDRLAELEGKLSELSGEPQGLLKVACPASFVLGQREFFSSFLRRYPRVRLQLHESDHLVDLIAEGYDFALRGGRGPDPSLEGERLLYSPGVLVASPEYLASHGEVGDPRDLQTDDHRLVALGEHPNLRWELHSGVRAYLLEGTARAVSNNMRTLTCLVEDGLGVGRVPMVSCAEAIEAGRLVHLLPGWTSGSGELWLISTSRRGATAAAAAFHEHARAWSFQTF